MSKDPRTRTDYDNMSEAHLNYVKESAKAVASRIAKKLQDEKSSKLYQQLVYDELAKYAPQPEQPPQPLFNEHEDSYENRERNQIFNDNY
ncbi:MAG: hypothetical protein ACFCUR_20815 [Rhodomicrobiaceae bacterium]